MDQQITLQSPEVQQAAQWAEAAPEEARRISISTVEEYDSAGGYLRGIKARQRDLETMRTSITQPINASLRAINDFFREPAERLKAAENALNSSMGQFRAEQQRVARIAKAEAEELARKERAIKVAAALEAERITKAEADRVRAAAAAAEAEGKAALAAKLADRAATIEERREADTEAQLNAPVEAAVPAVAAAPKLEGIHVRTAWKFRVVNAALVPREFLAVSEALIRARVAADKGDTVIPGVEIYAEETTVVARGKS